MKERYFHTFYFIRIVVGFFLSLALKFVFKAEFSILFIFIRWECVSPLAMQRQATMRRQISVSQRTAMETWNKIIFVVKAFFSPVIFAYIITHFANDWVNKVQKFLVRFVFFSFPFLTWWEWYLHGIFARYVACLVLSHSHLCSFSFVTFCYQLKLHSRLSYFSVIERCMRGRGVCVHTEWCVRCVW